MNQIYSLVLNHSTGACQAVSEVAKGSHQAASATGGEAWLPRRTRLASACLIALATLAGTSAWAQDTSGSITGTQGANGAFGFMTGANGTAGSNAVQASSNGTHSGVLTGGAGGTGGPGLLRGGSGGSGGAGLSSAVDGVVLFNTGTVQGGRGGDGGSGATRGPGGAGGTGVQLTAPGTLLNEGIIEGGRGGGLSLLGLGSPATSAGGVGVTVTGGASFENTGTVRGGLSGDGLSRADAIRFTGDNNWLGLVSTSVIEGNVIATTSNSDTLGLTGSTDASFNTALIGPTAQYRNFAGFQKLGTSTWTLTGTTTALMPWQIFSGTLAISSDANLGDAAGLLTLDGGTLRTTANITASRAVVLGAANGTLETEAGTTYTANGVISGSGGLTKAGEGTATFTADNTYTGSTTISAGTLELGNGGTSGAIVGDVSNSATLAFNRSNAAVFDGVISGTGSVDQRGAGTTTLTGASTYTGGTTISAGTLELGNGSTSGAIVGDVSNNATLAFNRSDAAVFSGVISGTGNVQQRGAGTTTLTSANTYTGGTTISEGTLELGNGGTTGAIVGDVSNNATLAFNRSDATIFDGVISGTGSVQQRGAGTTTLTGASTYTGGTTISAGTLELGNGSTTGAIVGNVVNSATLAFNRSDATVFSGVISGTGSVDQRGVGTTTLTGASTYTGGTTISAGTLEMGNGGATGAITGDVANNATLAFNRSDATIFDGVISGTGNVQQRGTGTTTLAGASTYTGGTTITAGTLELGNGGATGAITGNVANNATLAFNRSNATIFDGVISGTGNVQQRGTGTTTLTGASTYTGGTTISAGTLELGNGGTTGAIVGDVANSGMLAFNRSDATVFDGVISGTGNVQQRGTGTTTLTGASTYTGGTTISAGTLELGNGGTSGAIVGDVSNNGKLAFNRSDATVFSGVISGTGSVDQRGAGTTTLTSANTYTGGTTISAGTLELGNGGTSGAIVGDIANSGTLAFNRSDAAVFDGVISGTGSVQQRGAGTTTLTGANTYTGGTTISAGTLELGNGGTSGAIVGDIANSGTLAFNRSDAAVFDGVISGTGSVQQRGTGTTTLTGASTYTGGTTISAGTLELGNGGTSGAIVGDVSNNATLAFNRSDATVFDGVISGTGSVDQRGAGTTTLTGASTYTGGTTISAGTLELGNGGATGAITGNVANSGTLAFNRSDAAVFSGVISGTGNVQQRGAGTTTLTGASTYTGGTTISAGTLELGNGGASGAIVGDVANSGTLAFNRSNTTLFEGAISGTGSVDQRGAGTTTLTGASTYTGGTTISAGTLELGNGGATGAIGGDVSNNATLAFNRSDAAVFDGVISGTGNVQQRGTGTTRLSGLNTYSGGTSVLAGTVAGSATSFGSGAMVNNAALVIDQASDGTLNNTLSGAGRITKTGAGALALGGNSAAFAGSTQVAAGTLAVNGSLGGALTVGNGARLGGTGSVGNTVVQSGATVAPGGSGIGTLNVAGNLTLAQGSVYQLNAVSDGRSDQLRVSGVATLQGGSVSVLASGNFQPTTSYSILSANGGVSGQFAGATTDMAFLQPFLTYSPQNVTLRLQRNDVSFQDMAQTPNQRAAAGAVSALGTGPLYSAVVQLNAANARSAFDSLSGEVHASVKSAAFEDSRFVRDASLGRLREAFDTPAAAATDTPAASGRGVWVQAFDSWGSSDGNGNASSVERSTRGIFLGADTRVGDDWRLGVLGGYSHGSVTPDNRPSWAKSDTYHVGVYGGKQWGQLGLRAGATYSAGEADTRRDIAFPGFSGQTAAKYDIKTTQAFGELGWKMPTANGSLEPFAGLAHVKLSTDGFTETGGVAALSSGNGSAHTTYSTIGLRGTSSAGMPGNQTRLRGMVGWRHAFGDVTPTSTLALAGQPGFAVAGVPIARNALVLEGGIDFAVGRNLTMNISYVGQAASQMSDHGVKASLLWKF